MTRHDPDPKTIATALELLTHHGFEGMAGCLEALLNEAMRLERSAHLGAGPYERSDGRRGYANGFKPKRVDGWEHSTSRSRRPVTSARASSPSTPRLSTEPSVPSAP